jgi:tetratricopeptide (TPR) repeat protein
MIKVAISGILLALGSLAVSRAAAQGAHSENSPLKNHYDAALRLQKAGELDAAAREYKLFLASALGELALGRAFAEKNYAKAAPLFDEALALEPESRPLRTEYAQAAYDAGDLEHAETLARQLLSADGAAPTDMALAHRILGRALLKQNRDQDARKEMEEAVRLDPSFANAYGLGEVCLDLDDGGCASRIFDEIVHSIGDTPEVHMQIGLAYGNSDFVPQAIAEFRKVIAENPSFPEAHYCLASALLAAGDYARNLPEAEAALKTELTISPRDYLTYAALGKLAVTGQRYEEAESYLKRATSLDPTNPDAFLYLGQMYFDTNHLQEAETALRKAIELTKDPSRNRFQIKKAHFLLGRILMQEHRADEAHAEMEITKTFADSGLSHDRGQLAGMLGNSGPDRTLSQREGIIVNDVSKRDDISLKDSSSVTSFENKMKPAIGDSYNNLGIIAAINKSYDDALIDFKHADKWNPALDGLDLNLGHAAFMASRFTEAAGPLARYIAGHPGDSGIRVALAMSQFMTGDYAGCLATVRPAAGEMDSVPQLAYVYAESLVRTGEIVDGRRRLESLESSHPEIEEVHRSLGEVYESEKDLLKAARELRTAIVLSPADPDAHYNLGKIYIESGDATAAVAELEATVKLAPENPIFHRELAAAYRLASRKDDEAKEMAIYDRIKNPLAGGNKSALQSETDSAK